MRSVRFFTFFLFPTPCHRRESFPYRRFAVYFICTFFVKPTLIRRAVGWALFSTTMVRHSHTPVSFHSSVPIWRVLWVLASSSTRCFFLLSFVTWTLGRDNCYPSGQLSWFEPYEAYSVTTVCPNILLTRNWNPSLTNAGPVTGAHSKDGCNRLLNVPFVNLCREKGLNPC